MRVAALEGHRLWAASYDAAPNPLLALEARLLPGLLGPVAGKRVVDVACGTARWAARLAECGAEVFGLDLCADMLRRAPANLQDRLVLADAGALPIASETADLTICSFAAGYFADVEHAISEMARVTRRGGRLVISDLDPAAVAAGWTRSFRADGVVYEIEHFAWTPECIVRAAKAAALELKSELHGSFGAPEFAVFAAAGKAERFRDASRVPAVWIARWEKA